MQNIQNLTVKNLIQLRPAAVEKLERWGGFKFWNRLDERLPDFLKSVGKTEEDALELLNAPIETVVGEDWSELPLYRLIDHLVANHREFREKEIPGIVELLDKPGLPHYPEGYALKLIQQEFRSFQIDFLLHMDEEENYLFPKALRTEACALHSELPSEIFKGSVSAYPAMLLHSLEEKLKHALTNILEKLRNLKIDPKVADLAQNVCAALERLECKLVLHANLETEVLQPRAAELEKILNTRNRQSVKVDRFGF